MGPFQGHRKPKEASGFVRGSANRLFDDFAVQFFDSDHSSTEDRFIMLGMSSEARLLVVVHCEREAGDVIRIISARRATRSESTFYGGN